MADVADVRAKLAQGRLKDAMAAVLEVLRTSPEDADALGLFGRALLESGQAVAAAAALERAIRAGATESSTRHAAALALEAAGDRDGAEQILRDSAAADPDGALLLAAMLTRSGRTDDALALLRDRRDATGLLYRAHALLVAGWDAHARTTYASAVALDPAVRRYHAPIVNELGFVGLESAARATLARGLLLEPDEGELLHLHAAYEGLTVEGANERYVEAVFDRFAASFETRLRDDLEYRVPEELDRLLESARGAPDGSLEILDVGCGTGLLGGVVAPRAGRLDGVDISGEMLARAERRHCYDRLVKGEILATLPLLRHHYDVVLAADVLIYFGALDPFFARCRDVLRPGGLLGFSIERGSGAGDLQPNGRFAHSLQTTSTALAGAGFRVCEARDTVVRLELSEPVAGHNVIAELAA